MKSSSADNIVEKQVQRVNANVFVLEFVALHAIRPPVLSLRRWPVNIIILYISSTRLYIRSSPRRLGPEAYSILDVENRAHIKWTYNNLGIKVR